MCWSNVNTDKNCQDSTASILQIFFTSHADLHANIFIILAIYVCEKDIHLNYLWTGLHLFDQK